MVCSADGRVVRMAGSHHDVGIVASTDTGLVPELDAVDRTRGQSAVPLSAVGGRDQRVRDDRHGCGGCAQGNRLPYPAYKDSGVECLGDIPVHWAVKRVKNLSGFVASGSRCWAEHCTDDGLLFLTRAMWMQILSTICTQICVAAWPTLFAPRAEWG